MTHRFRGAGRSRGRRGWPRPYAPDPAGRGRKTTIGGPREPSKDRGAGRTSFRDPEAAAGCGSGCRPPLTRPVAPVPAGARAVARFGARPPRRFQTIMRWGDPAASQGFTSLFRPANGRGGEWPDARRIGTEP